MNIYVGNLSLETTEDDLHSEFAGFGKVISVTIMNDQYIGSGQTKAYGFVEMESKSEGNAAISCLDGRKLKGRTISVVEALPLSDRTGLNLSGKGTRFNRKSRTRAISTETN